MSLSNARNSLSVGHARLRKAAVAASSLAFLSGGCQYLAGIDDSPQSNCKYADDECESEDTCSVDNECSAEGKVCAQGHCRDAVKIAAGGATTCAILSGGVVWCWGLNTQGQCGQIHEILAPGGKPAWLVAPVQPRPAPVLLPATVRDITVGGDAESGHACALLSGGEVWCWGASASSEAGSGRGGEDWVIPNRIDLPADLAQVERVVAGHGRTCLLGPPKREEGNRLWCWGDNSVKQTLPGGWTPVRAPSPVVGLSHVTEVALGANHTCALSEQGLSCWGDPAVLPCGEGIGNGVVRVALDGVAPGDIRGIAASDRHTCLLTGEAVYCLAPGAPSAGTQTCTLPPAVRLDTEGTGQQIAAGGTQTCVSWSSGAVKCWDLNALFPLVKAYDDLGAADLAVGVKHACARGDGAQIRCWGDNEASQLGQGKIQEDDSAPVEEPRPVKWYQSSVDDPAGPSPGPP